MRLLALVLLIWAAAFRLPAVAGQRDSAQAAPSALPAVHLDEAALSPAAPVQNVPAVPEAAAGALAVPPPLAPSAALAEPAAGPASALVSPAVSARGPPAAGIDAFLAQARQGDSPQTRAWLEKLPALFDGSSADERERLIRGLEGLVVSAKKVPEYRNTLQRFVAQDELSRAEPRLRGVPLTPERKKDVLEKTRFHDVRWYDHFVGEVQPVPHGIAKPDLSLTLNVHRGWAKLPSFVDHFRALFTHEYTHRLQFEGEYSSFHHQEPSAVSSEMLRAIELVGLEGVRQGRVTILGPTHLEMFESGRAWVRGEKPDDTGFFFKGFLAGAAYELAEQTGRWADAWDFHRAVSRGQAPREAAADIRAAAQPQAR